MPSVDELLNKARHSSDVARLSLRDMDDVIRQIELRAPNTAEWQREEHDKIHDEVLDVTVDLEKLISVKGSFRRKSDLLSVSVIACLCVLGWELFKSVWAAETTSVSLMVATLCLGICLSVVWVILERIHKEDVARLVRKLCGRLRQKETPYRD